MIKSALRFLQNYLIEERIIKVPYQAEAIRYFNYPYPAIEEALVNDVSSSDMMLENLLK